MVETRKPFQGVLNIIRFNWHFYLAFALVLFVALLLIPSLPPLMQSLGFWGIGLATVSMIFSLLISTWVYDLSSLYSLQWLKEIPNNSLVLNINAGFDETSGLITEHYPSLSVEICDFYDPQKHTEVSIKRARKAYPQHPKTVSVSTSSLPFAVGHFAACIATLSAHEIRDRAERIAFFKELKRVLSKDGKIYVTEHLRDLPNFLAYSIGAFHFHSLNTWEATFQAAKLEVVDRVKTTPFVTTFVLAHGDPS